MTVAVTCHLEELTCPSCGMMFAFPGTIVAERRKDHETFYCPAGHTQSFRGKSEEEKLREQLAIAKSQREQADAARATALKEKDAAIDEQIKLGQKLRRVKQRVQGGKCPCCQKNVTALRRHMADKHPDFAKS